MSGWLPNDDQRQMLRAVRRVLGPHLTGWRAARTALSRLAGRTATERPPAPRSVWGWGYEGDGPDPLQVDVLVAFLEERWGLDPLPVMDPPDLDALPIRPPRFELPDELRAFCTDDKRERLARSYGKALRDILRGLHGQYPNPTDWVATPSTEDEILALIRFCQENQVSLVIYGGGTSVVGGVEPTTSERYKGTITLDMRRFDRLLEVDPVSRACRAQAGIFGPALEDALKPHGLSPRFYPQSFEFSTLGGWIATRAGGHYCTLYTHIDDLVESVRVVTPAGVHETRRLPASGAGPSQERLWLGSEGTLGVITEAWIRLHPRPTYRSSAVVRFADLRTGAEAVRELSQSKLYPVNCRLVSRLEALAMGIGDGAHAVLLLGFESAREPQKAAMAASLAICARHGGRWSRRKVVHKTSAIRSGSGGSWRQNFLKAPYLRDLLAQRGLVAETFETAVTWDRFEELHDALVAAADRAFREHCEGRGVLTCRFTHVYPDGPAPYYTVMAWAPEGRQLETWDALKAALSDALIAHGATITHHHAVGRDHRPWYETERGELFGTVLTGLKNTLDPEWVLNPGVLLREPEPRGSGGE